VFSFFHGYSATHPPHRPNGVPFERVRVVCIWAEIDDHESLRNSRVAPFSACERFLFQALSPNSSPGPALKKRVLGLKIKWGCWGLVTETPAARRAPPGPCPQADSARCAAPAVFGHPRVRRLWRGLLSVFSGLRRLHRRAGALFQTGLRWGPGLSATAFW